MGKVCHHALSCVCDIFRRKFNNSNGYWIMVESIVQLIELHCLCESITKHLVKYSYQIWQNFNTYFSVSHLNSNVFIYRIILVREREEKNCRCDPIAQWIFGIIDFDCLEYKCVNFAIQSGLAFSGYEYKIKLQYSIIQSGKHCILKSHKIASNRIVLPFWLLKNSLFEIDLNDPECDLLSRRI